MKASRAGLQRISLSISLSNTTMIPESFLKLEETQRRERKSGKETPDFKRSKSLPSKFSGDKTEQMNRDPEQSITGTSGWVGFRRTEAKYLILRLVSSKKEHAWGGWRKQTNVPWLMDWLPLPLVPPYKNTNPRLLKMSLQWHNSHPPQLLLSLYVNNP